MSEYAFLNKMLSNKYQEDDETVMKEKKFHSVKILKDNRVKYTLYRFDREGKGDFLPFFDASDDAPKRLCSFCDYVIIAEVRQKPYVILVEMKNSHVGHAHEQLKGSRCFVNYITETAERIKGVNGQDEFSKDKINVLEIVLINVNTRPSVRSGKHMNILIDDKGVINYKTVLFDIAHVCKYNSRIS